MLPPAIQAEVDGLHKDLGRAAEIEQVSRSRYRLTVTTDRVHLTVDFKLTPSGRAVWAGSTLAVDGKDRSLASSAHELAHIFADPDGYKVTLPELPPEASLDDAPQIIRPQYKVLRDKIPEQVPVHLGRGGTGCWIIAIEAPDRQTGIHIHFHRRKGRAMWYPHVTLVIEGVDRSQEVDDDINMALALLAGTEIVAPSTAKSASKVAPTTTEPKRFGSVEQRRNSVIRN